MPEELKPDQKKNNEIIIAPDGEAAPQFVCPKKRKDVIPCKEPHVRIREGFRPATDGSVIPASIYVENFLTSNDTRAVEAILHKHGLVEIADYKWEDEWQALIIKVRLNTIAQIEEAVKEIAKVSKERNDEHIAAIRRAGAEAKLYSNALVKLVETLNKEIDREESLL